MSFAGKTKRFISYLLITVMLPTILLTGCKPGTKTNGNNSYGGSDYPDSEYASSNGSISISGSDMSSQIISGSGAISGISGSFSNQTSSRSGSVSNPNTPTQRSNFFGIHTLISDTDNMEQQLDWAHKLVGDGGYIKQMFYNITKTTNGPSSNWVKLVKEIYKRNMIPVIRVAGTYQNGYWLKPEATKPGDYSELAAAIKSVFEKIPLKAGVPLYVEVYNEPNLKVEWSNEMPNPVEYGKMLVQISKALKSIGDPRIKVLNGALSPGGNYNNVRFVEKMVKEVPESLYAFDYWACHPYPSNHPPEYNNHDKTSKYKDFTIDSYTLELAILEKYGRKNTKVLLTETGYELGNNMYGFEGFKPITEEMRTDFTKRAFRDYWSKWDEIIAVCPFEMVSTNGAWLNFDWIKIGSGTDANGFPKDAYPQFKAVADLKKLPYVKDPSLQNTKDANMDFGVNTSNYAIGAKVTVSSTINDWGWHYTKVNNGFTNDADLGWTSEGKNNTEWVVYEFNEAKDISRIKLYPRSDGAEAGKYFPQAFEVQTSNDGVNWKTVYAKDYPTLFNPGKTPYNYRFNPVKTKYLRLYITKLTNNGSGGYHAQLSEFEVYKS